MIPIYWVVESKFEKTKTRFLIVSKYLIPSDRSNDIQYCYHTLSC